VEKLLGKSCALTAKSMVTGVVAGNVPSLEPRKGDFLTHVLYLFTNCHSY